jgi:hypothetical protein
MTGTLPRRSLSAPITDLLDWAAELPGWRRLLPVRRGPRGLGHHGERILVVFDIDQSLVKWQEYNLRAEPLELERVAGWVQRSHAGGLVRIALNTGRTLHSVQRIAPLLGPIPVDVLVTCDGQQLYWNPAGEPTASWLLALSARAQDRVWLRSHAGAWDERLARKVLWQSYRRAGFRPASRRQFEWSHDVDRLMRLPPGVAGPCEVHAIGTGEGPAIKIRYARPARAAVEAFVSQVVQHAIDRLDGFGIRALPDLRSWTPFWPQEADRAYLVAGLKHPTINKGSPINWIIAEMERLGGRITGVIPVGDSPNDEGMIVPRWYVGRDGRTVPNLPIYHDAGNREDRVLREIQHHDEAVIVSRVSEFGRRAQWAPDLPAALRSRISQLEALAPARARPTAGT